MLLASDRIAERSSGQNRQGILDHGSDSSREDLESNRIVQPASGLQIELRRPGCQDRFAAQNDAARMDARGEFRKPNGCGAVTEAVIGAWGWPAESVWIQELKSAPWILICLPAFGR